MNELRIFENEQFGQMRTFFENGETWLAGKDIADALGYKNTKDALASHVDDDDKRLVQRSEIATFELPVPKDVLPVECVTAHIPPRGMIFINESGVYSLILRSNLPNARAFKRWITHEVLPAIRKTGAYSVRGETLTVDQYLQAAEIVAGCRPEQTPRVRHLLEQAGFSFPDEQSTPRITSTKPREDKIDRREFCHRLKGLMLEHEVTGSALASAMGCAYMSVYRWSRGQGIPNANYIAAICKFFNVPRSYFVT